ncbi:conjugal transfer protein, partial [Klebsiella pneumoniae]|nr:conjugal transfer protein [Klebsiella pneumoniae]
MSEEKRPVLSLKRKPAENSTAPAEATPAPGVVRRKKVVVVSSPPAWKAKKAKL